MKPNTPRPYGWLAQTTLPPLKTLYHLPSPLLGHFIGAQDIYFVWNERPSLTLLFRFLSSWAGVVNIGNDDGSGSGGEDGDAKRNGKSGVCPGVGKRRREMARVRREGHAPGKNYGLDHSIQDSKNIGILAIPWYLTWYLKRCGIRRLHRRRNCNAGRGTRTEHAGHGDGLVPSRPHPTPTRRRTQKKKKEEAKREMPRVWFGLLAPNVSLNSKPNDAKASRIPCERCLVSSGSHLYI